MSNYTPIFKPTNKRRSFRPSSFRPLDTNTQPPSLAILSENLRASLMNVGMRVRKSVPEGYKTLGKDKAGFSIYEQTAAAHPELGVPSKSSNPLLPPVDISRAMTKDDLEKRAMTDEQIAATVEDVLSGLDADLAGWGENSISSSQESTSSTVSNVSSVRSVPAGRRKRTLANDDEDERDIWGSTPMERDAPLRQIAQPRSRRPQLYRNSSSSSSKAGKTVRFAPTAPDDDFDEADFLMPDQP